ncbi:hypothetical protein PMAYCL1PPCAC_10050, partial [Pristionchus mayeri]
NKCYPMPFLVPSVVHNRGVKRPAPGAAPKPKPAPPATKVENKPKTVRDVKKDELADELHNLWTQDVEDMTELMRLQKVLKENDVPGGEVKREGAKVRREMTKDERLSHWNAVMDRITAIYERKYDRLIRHDCLKNRDPSDNSVQLLFIASALQDKHKEYPIDPNWIRWAVSRLLLSLTGRIVYDKMGADISNHLLQLLLLMKEDQEEMNDLLRTAIDQMHEIAKKAKSITLTRPTVPPELRVEIPFELINDCETVIQLTIVDLLLTQPSFFDFSFLTPKPQLQLWSVLFSMAQNRSLSARHSSVQLMHRLLSLELASMEIVRVVVDYSVALLKAYPPVKKEADKTIHLRNFVVTIIQLLTDHLRKLGRSRLMRGAQATVLIGWACSVLKVVETWQLESVEEGRRVVVNGHRNVLRTFCTIICRVVSSIRVDAAAYLKVPIKELEEGVKRLISALLFDCALSVPSLRAGASPAAAAAAAEERMACAAELLLFVDDLNGNEQNSLWISKETDSTLAKWSDREEAALRARHLVVSSLAPKNQSRRGPASQDRSQQQSQQGDKAAAAAASASAATPSTKALLQRLLPDNNQILQHISSVASLPEERGIAVLQALFSLVAQMIPLSQQMAATAVAVLSLPWLATEPDVLLSCKAQYRSLPLLKEFFHQKLPGIVKKACSASSLLRECTLAPLASLPRPALFCEWRRKIFEKALTLKPSKNAPSIESLSIVNSALDSLSSFVSSVQPEAYERTLSLVMDLVNIEQLERSPVHIEHVIRAVADSLCALDGVSRRVNEETGEHRCMACDRLQKEGVAAAHPVCLPKEFGDLMVKVFNDESIRLNTIENRIDSYSILFAILCHVQDAVKRFEKVIIASLPLIKDKDDEVRKEYEWTFKVILTMNPSQKLIKEIGNAFEIADDSVCTPEDEQNIYEFSAPFLALCASEGRDVKFQKTSREKMYERAMQYPSSSLLTQLAREMHISVAQKDKEIGGDAKRFFARQIRTLSRMLSTELLNVVIDARSEKAEKEQIKEEDWTKRLNQSCDYVLQAAATIWGFESVQSLLRSCASHVVAECFVIDETLHPAGKHVIERIKAHLGRYIRSLIEECLPAIVERIIKVPTASKSAAKLARNFGASMRDLLDARRYHCTFFVLRMMAENEEKALQLLLTVNRLEGKTFTDVIAKRCEYLGYLLSLRRSLHEDENFEIRGTIVSSIRVIINLLDEGFLDDISSKMMNLLRAATAVGEEAVEVWTAFVEKLDKEVLVSLLPQVLIAIQPLLRFESSSVLLKTIFEQREAMRQKDSASFERAVMVLLGGEGSFDDDDGSMRIRKCLTKRRIPQVSMEDVIRGCAQMLREEGETVGRVVLRRLEYSLDGRPLRDDLAAAVMPALLHTIRVCADADVRLAAARCIGMVGAVDPGRLGLSLEVQRREGKG